MPSHIARFLSPLGLSLLLLALAVAALLALPAAPGQALKGALQASTTAPTEAWRLGIASEGDASYNAVIGRLVGANASFRSNRGVTDIYYIFPAPASSRTITSAAWNIISRSGAYAGTASLTLEIRDFSGALQHTVSSAPVDLEAATLNTWTTMALSATPANLTIAPGEYLAFRFTLDGASTGDLDVRPMFEVVVQ
jgi:hypothetical protein